MRFWVCCGIYGNQMSEMEIDTIAEWDAICRICLQEGQLHSLFDFDDEKSDLNIAEKIMLCSPIMVSIYRGGGVCVFLFCYFD